MISGNFLCESYTEYCYIYTTRNVWQSLACSLRGIAVTPPSE